MPMKRGKVHSTARVGAESVKDKFGKEQSDHSSVDTRGKDGVQPYEGMKGAYRHLNERRSEGGIEMDDTWHMHGTNEHHHANGNRAHGHA